MIQQLFLSMRLVEHPPLWHRYTETFGTLFDSHKPVNPPALFQWAYSICSTLGDTVEHMPSIIAVNQSEMRAGASEVMYLKTVVPTAVYTVWLQMYFCNYRHLLHAHSDKCMSWSLRVCFVREANEAISIRGRRYLIHITAALFLWTRTNISDVRRFTVLDVTERWLIPFLIWETTVKRVTGKRAPLNIRTSDKLHCWHMWLTC